MEEKSGYSNLLLDPLCFLSQKGENWHVVNMIMDNPKRLATGCLHY